MPPRRSCVTCLKVFPEKSSPSPDTSCYTCTGSIHSQCGVIVTTATSPHYNYRTCNIALSLSQLPSTITHPRSLTTPPGTISSKQSASVTSTTPSAEPPSWFSAFLDEYRLNHTALNNLTYQLVQPSHQSQGITRALVLQEPCEVKITGLPLSTTITTFTQASTVLDYMGISSPDLHILGHRTLPTRQSDNPTVTQTHTTVLQLTSARIRDSTVRKSGKLHGKRLRISLARVSILLPTFVPFTPSQSDPHSS